MTSVTQVAKNKQGIIYLHGCPSEVACGSASCALHSGTKGKSAVPVWVWLVLIAERKERWQNHAMASALCLVAQSCLTFSILCFIYYNRPTMQFYPSDEGMKLTVHSVHLLFVSNSLRPHGLQHTRPPCPSSTPRVYSNSCPLSRWCHPTSHPLSNPSPPASSLSQHQGIFKWVSSLNQVAKVLDFQLQHQSFQWIFRTDFL